MVSEPLVAQSRRPKVHISDSGLAASLIGVNLDALASPTAPASGPLLETFAVNEIARQLAASPQGYTLHHWRNHQDREHRGREIDLIIEAPNGDVVAVEIKATSSPSADAVNHLRWLRDKLDASNPGTFPRGRSSPHRALHPVCGRPPSSPPPQLPLVLIAVGPIIGAR